MTGSTAGNSAAIIRCISSTVFILNLAISERKAWNDE